MAAHALYRRALPAAARVTAWHAPDGWTHRRFDWPAPDTAQRGALLFLGGRGDVFEKYLESFAHWHTAGWAVTSFDWRGQGGSGRCAADPHCGHVDRFELYVDDLAAFVGEWRTQSAGPYVAVGHSLGGHLLLRALAERRIVLDAAVLAAPMLGMIAPGGATIGGALAGVLARTHLAGRPAWRGGERPFSRHPRAASLTHDAARHEDEAWWHVANPRHRTGPPSWRWLSEAFRSVRQLRTDPALAEVTTPVQLLVAEADRRVDARGAIAVAARLPHAELIRFGPDCGHEILREADPVRTRALDSIDRFLARHAPVAVEATA